jgi:hypothetical protein
MRRRKRGRAPPRALPCRAADGKVKVGGAGVRTGREVSLISPEAQRRGRGSILFAPTSTPGGGGVSFKSRGDGRARSLVHISSPHGRVSMIPEGLRACGVCIRRRRHQAVQPRNNRISRWRTADAGRHETQAMGPVGIKSGSRRAVFLGSGRAWAKAPGGGHSPLNRRGEAPGRNQ